MTFIYSSGQHEHCYLPASNDSPASQRQRAEEVEGETQLLLQSSRWRGNKGAEMVWTVKQEGGINKETKTGTTVRDRMAYKKPNSPATVCINYRPEPDSRRKDKKDLTHNCNKQS